MVGKYQIIYQIIQQILVLPNLLISGGSFFDLLEVQLATDPL